MATPAASPQPAAPPDSSAELLRRTLPLMSRHAAGYAPDSYALWYEYVRGGSPALRAELDLVVETVRDHRADFAGLRRVAHHATT